MPISKKRKAYLEKTAEQRNALRRKQYQLNKNKIAERRKVLRSIKGKEHYANQKKKYLSKDGGQKSREYALKYHYKNREQQLRKMKERRLRPGSQERRAEYRKEYYKKNKESILSHIKFRRKTNINYKIGQLIRGRYRTALKRNKKLGSAVKDLGCTLGEFKQYLESKFQPGMTWENHSRDGWHLDHIIPVSFFDLTNKDEFLKCFHYTNYQPLWATENRIKGNKLPNDIEAERRRAAKESPKEGQENEGSDEVGVS